MEERALSHTALSGPEGRLLLAAFPGEQTFLATSGRLSSDIWKGTDPVAVELVLVPTFSVRGTLDYPDRDQWDPGFESERRVEIAVREGWTWRTIAMQRNLEHEFHIPRVPIAIRANLYRIRLEGSPILTEDRYFAPPREGDLLNFPFTGIRGVGAFLFVDDEAGTPVATATARLSWEVDGIASRQVFGASRPDGFLYLGSSPPGNVRIQVEAPGYATYASVHSLPIDGSIWVTLERAQSVRGVCRQNGRPMEDFELIFWKNDSFQSRVTHAVRRAKEGLFELELSPGSWSIQAASDAHPACNPLVIDVPSEAASRIELDLPAALLGGGIVLDAESEEPLGGAVVQAYSGDGKDRTFRWGQPALTAADGSFELSAFVRGRN
ncbi:MAG: carboxypeptidase-like regulatory domain-containing protein, partial [Planctomycetota bacterium]